MFWEDTTEDTEEEEVVPMMESCEGWMDGMEVSSTSPSENWPPDISIMVEQGRGR
jgi:hypothetical protein